MKGPDGNSWMSKLHLSLNLLLTVAVDYFVADWEKGMIRQE